MALAVAEPSRTLARCLINYLQGCGHSVSLGLPHPLSHFCCGDGYVVLDPEQQLELSHPPVRQCPKSTKKRDRGLPPASTTVRAGAR